MSKKFIVILLGIMLCLCLAFCACKNSAGGGNGDSTDNSQQETGGENGEVTQMYIYVNDNKLEVKLENNSTVDELVALLKQGNITYTANANNFEIYGDIGHSLTTNNTQITSEVGDVLLWAGSNICIFFGHNSYSYTRIGKIEGYTADTLRAILAKTSTVQVTIGLE